MKFHRLILGNMGTNCYIIADENTREAIMFDAPDNTDIILQFLEENNYSLKKILLTHGHYDHILALADTKNATGAKVYIHELENDFLKNNILNLSEMMNSEYKEATADKLIKDNDVIKLNDIEIEVIHTPGHTKGGVCYLIKKDRLLICGDTLFCNSIGRTDMPTGDSKALINSIKTRLMTLDDNIRVYPGHGMETTIGNERKENPYLK